MYHISNNNKEISWIGLNKKVQVLLHYIVLGIAHKTICNMFVEHFNDFLSPSHIFPLYLYGLYLCIFMISLWLMQKQLVAHSFYDL